MNMRETPARTPPIRVDYTPGVVLGIPVVAEGEAIGRLYDYAQTASGPSLSDVARQLGITPPSTQHRWAIGWSAPAGPEPTPRLVWYDPDKLAGIDAMVRRIAAEHPHVTEVIVAQGPGWSDWTVAFCGEDDGEVPARTESTAPTEAAAHREAVGEP